MASNSITDAVAYFADGHLDKQSIFRYVHHDILDSVGFGKLVLAGPPSAAKLVIMCAG